MAIGKIATWVDESYRTFQEEVAGALDGKEFSLVECGTANNSVKLNTGTGNEMGVFFEKLQPGTGRKDDINVRLLGKEGTVKMIQNAAINYGARVYPDPAAPTKVIAVPGAPALVVTDGVTTNASPTVTSATAAFTPADVGKPIAGAGIPAASYIGVVNSPQSIGLSSSQTANTPVNATATAAGVTLTMPGRTSHIRSVGRKVSEGGGAQNDVIEVKDVIEQVVLP